MKHFIRTYFVALALAPLAAAAQTRPALVLYDARIYTADAAKPIASAVVIRGDRIAFVGSDAEARAFAGKGAVSRDMEGRTYWHRTCDPTLQHIRRRNF